ncbi:MAG: alpha/beta hydrolase [Anaerolineae bacterium]|nr:alpha/beta hydrolase [Anaerolineae bacterium]
MSWFEYGTSRIYYEEQGDGNPVLLLPGLTDRNEHHMPLRDALTAAGYRVIAADLPGSGRSEPQPRTYTVTYFEDDAHAFVALLDSLGAVPAHLMGFSDGGDVSLLMAALTPHVARSLVTWGAAGRLSDPTGQLRQALYNVVDNPIPPMQSFSKQLIATYGKDKASAMTQNASRAISDIIEARGGDISLSKAGNIASPTLVITGEHDPFAPPALLAQLASAIPAAEMITVPDVGHDIHNARPEWFVQTVLDWLKRYECASQIQ